MTAQELALFAAKRDEFVDELIACVMDHSTPSLSRAQIKLLELHVEQMNVVLASHDERDCLRDGAPRRCS